MDEIKMVMGEEGVFRKWEEPFATIECQTEEDFEYIKSAVDFYENHKWIPVTERKPEHEDIVIAFFPELRGTGFAIQIQKGWSVEPRYCSHWMPLPEPPKEDEDA